MTPPRASSAARAFVYDSGDLDAIPGLLDGVEEALGPIDIYVANTGGPPPNADLLGFTREQWEAAHRTLVLAADDDPGPPAATDGPSAGWGRVVAVQSSAVHEPISMLQLSNAHRPGMVVGFKVLAKEHAGKGVTLNTLHPGRIATDRIIDTAGSREAAEEAARDSDPRRPPGRARRHGRRRGVLLLASRPLDITGTTLLVDGGDDRRRLLVEPLRRAPSPLYSWIAP